MLVDEEILPTFAISDVWQSERRICRVVLEIKMKINRNPFSIHNSLREWLFISKTPAVFVTVHVDLKPAFTLLMKIMRPNYTNVGIALSLLVVLYIFYQLFNRSQSVSTTGGLAGTVTLNPSRMEPL